VRKKALWVLGLSALTLLLSACADPELPQNTMAPAGDNAQKSKDLFMPVFWVAAAVFVLVEGAIVFIVFKYRHRKGRDVMPAQTHGNTRLEVGWTIAPAVVLAFVMVPTIGLIWDLAERPPEAMNVRAIGYQWWWGFEYEDPEMTVDYGAQGPITTADTMVVPVGRPIDISLEARGGGAQSDDGVPDYEVIHSFWAPRLFGKQDAMPGRENHIVFTATEPGTYWGQCAEFCGLQHTMMLFRIVVLSQEDFDAWVQQVRQPAEEPTDALAREGMDLFLNGVSGGGQCVACHAIGGTEASSAAGPDLTHFADPTHECFAGCNWDTFNEDGSINAEDLSAWLRDPDAVKMGAKMPNYDLTEDEIEALVAYLATLR
jgi:cytochrome c oxidase subunit II